jgi:phage recombination protein Bet
MSDVATPQPADLRAVFFPGLADEHFALVLAFCRERGLDPWSSHVWAEGRWDDVKKQHRVVVGVRIDGLRSKAAATGEYAGNDAAEFFYDSGADHPDRARATVHRLVKGHVRPFTGEASFSEYYPAGGDTGMWNRMPRAMLGKCAEAVALRKGFPELAGLYTREERERSLSAPPARGTDAAAPAHELPDDGPIPVYADEPEPPATQRQLLLRFVDLGVPPWRRHGIIEEFRQKRPGLQERDPAEFAAWVWREVRARPGDFGVETAGTRR